MHTPVRDPEVLKVMAFDVFNVFHLVAPDGHPFIPPYFIMTAAREMGYFPTSQYLQRVVSFTTEPSGRMTQEPFLQMCHMLECTRTFDNDTVQRYKQAFDIHGNGKLTRSEFRVILATSATSEMTSCEIEAVVNLLDPHGTDIINLSDLGELLTKYLVGDVEHSDRDVLLSDRSSDRSRFLTSSSKGGMLDSVTHVVVPDARDRNRGSFVVDTALSGDSPRAGRVMQHATAPESSSHSSVGGVHQPTSARGKRDPSPIAPLAAEGLHSSPGRTSGGIPPPKTTVPSPCLSGAVTRATSIVRCHSFPSPEVSTNLGLSPPPVDTTVNLASVDTGSPQHATKIAARASRMDQQSNAVSFSDIPSGRDTMRGNEEAREFQTSSDARCGINDGAFPVRRVLSIPSLEDMRDVSVDNSRCVSHQGGTQRSRGDNADSQGTADGRHSVRSVGTSTGPQLHDHLREGRHKQSSAKSCCRMF
uniref:WGS project CAEQ00000000 data, annotated contig 606 n=1 Tax=Trypanosoma congolense (strain IL3000) TaxID=1068625 RepID=F9WH71_TRYCI|nr:unnamed protein product [Trypanosoma congolense IL3000]